MNPDQAAAVHAHPQEVRIGDVRADPNLRGDEGWVGMDVQRIVTRNTVGSRQTVFGITTFPPGARHDIHSHQHAEEVEYLIEGAASRVQCHQQVRSIADGD